MPQISFEQNWRKRFERYAAFDDDAKIAGWSEHSLNTRVQTFLAHWQVKPDMNWLDIGCGAGTYTQLLLNQNQRVVASDYSFPTLKKAQAKLKYAVPFSTADVRKLPFKQASFDGILCFGVLQALEHPLQVFNELQHVIKPQGEMWVDALNRRCIFFLKDWLKYKLFAKDYRLNYVSPSAVIAKLRMLGFHSIEIIWLPILPQKLAVIQKLLFLLTKILGNRARWVCQIFSHAYMIKAKR